MRCTEQTTIRNGRTSVVPPIPASPCCFRTKSANIRPRCEGQGALTVARRVSLRAGKEVDERGIWLVGSLKDDPVSGREGKLSAEHGKAARER